MPRSGRPEPVRCLPASRREPAFPDKGRTSPQAPKQRKPRKYSWCDRRSGSPWKISEPRGELFPMTPVLLETGQHKDQTIALPAGRHGRSRKRQAAIRGRCMVVGWVTAPPPSLRPQHATAHAMGIAPRAAATLPADLIQLPRISSNRVTVSPSRPLGIPVPSASTPCHPPRPVTPPPAVGASPCFLIRPPAAFFFRKKRHEVRQHFQPLLP